ncbi:MBL fold metallo-hydrolase [Corynebacterium sp. MSK035]|uniref:MBL fold metallo-hydrolase n=1 Tax=unclassified Corynebacterium TaxID=2624378 RepID=UPI0016527723|nr:MULTISPECIES: MBL fold metallo-hydrolase [unclassified Corynebacterium]MBC6794081.1 Zn-dependent hydrolase [Corynebacterium sp. LK26]MDK8811192.1 MBL fold metallo-hydrolase [Corynebacterium sp. MSK035]
MNDDITISPYSNSPSTRGVERIDYGNVTIYKTSVGPMDNNVYLLVDSREPDNSLLIDAATDADHLIRLVEHVGAQVRTIVTTHSHGDHVQALGELLQSFPARHITSSLDAADIPKPADQQLDGGETITFGEDITLPTFILRGHTKGGLCLDLSAKEAGALSDDTPSHHLFVGDSIFPGGVGKTYSPEDFTQLIDDVESRVFHVYPADSVIHPGHGKDTTVGVESPEVENWRQRGW